jgi:serine phosphatase RsbU (regulator of sigma subunit)
MRGHKSDSIFLNGKSWPLFHGFASLFILFVLAIQMSPLASYVDTRITAPILFQIRQKLGMTPPISPKLKILALDDSTFSYLGGPRLSHAQLVQLLQNIGKKQPKAILIDSLLSDQPETILQTLPPGVRELPVFSGHFPSRARLRFRQALTLDAKEYQAQTYLQQVGSLSSLPYQLDPRLGWNVYGNSPVYRDLVRASGHITYNPDGTISPFYQINEDIILPHISLFASQDIQLRSTGLWIDGRRVPLTSAGTVLINHRPPQELYDRSSSLRAALQRAMLGLDELQVKDGDVVLILLAFATGNTDFHEGGPFGEIPGGLLIASMLSDLLDGTWLHRLETDVPLILIFGVAGIVVGINARARRYWLVLVSTWITCSLAVVAIFVYGQTWFPWLLPLSAFTGTSLIHFAHVRIHDEMRMIMLEKNYYEEKALRLEEMQKKSELESNLALGRAVQKLLLPKALEGRFFGYHYTMRYRPIASLSGDWFYHWDHSLTERRLFIGDVMGTGPSAAIPMATIIGLLKDCEGHRISMEETLERLNSRLYEMFEQHVICSLSAMALHRDGRIELFNAGGPGWLRVGQKHTEYLNLKSQAIGVQPELSLARVTLDLEEQQSIFTFTDGYMRDSRDIKRLVRMLRKQNREILKVEDIDQFLQMGFQLEQAHDDQSLLCVTRTKARTRS